MQKCLATRRTRYVVGFIYMYYQYNKHREKEVQEKWQLSYLQLTTLKENYVLIK